MPFGLKTKTGASANLRDKFRNLIADPPSLQAFDFKLQESFGRSRRWQSSNFKMKI
jgi:hypothetical protein